MVHFVFDKNHQIPVDFEIENLRWDQSAHGALPLCLQASHGASLTENVLAGELGGPNDHEHAHSTLIWYLYLKIVIS